MELPILLLCRHTGSESCVYRIQSLQLELFKVAVPFDSPAFFEHYHVTISLVIHHFGEFFYACLSLNAQTFASLPRRNLRLFSHFQSIPQVYSLS